MGRRGFEYLVFPIGLSYIATALKGHTVKCFDPNLYDIDQSAEILEENLKDFHPDVVGISLRNIDTVKRKDPFIYFKAIGPMVRRIKRTNPKGKIVLGGTAFSLYAKEIMGRIQEIDYDVYLEGEETIVELLENLDSPEKVKGIFFRKNGKVHFSGKRSPPDFASLPVPGKDIVPIGRYVSHRHNAIGIQSKRGCPFSCSYCTYAFLSDKKIRLRDPAHVVDEIEEMTFNYNVKWFTFVDNVFNVPGEHARAICQELIRRKTPIKWSAWLTPKGFTGELLRLMHKAGCRRIRFSPDAATNKGLKAMSKGFTTDDIENSLQLLSKMQDVYVGYCFFCAYPKMTFRDVIQILKYTSRMSRLFKGRGDVVLGWIRIEPHTPIYHEAIGEKLIDPHTVMLPEEESQLLSLFYNPQRLSYSSFLFDLLIPSIEKEGPLWRILSAIIIRFA